MGDLFVSDGVGDNGADGAYWPDTMNTLGRACLDVINFRKAMGRPYASDRLLTVDFPFLRREINQAFQRLTGHRIEHSVIKLSDGDIVLQYNRVRKGHYKVLASGKAVISDRPLFDDSTEGSCIVYAYTARIAKWPGLRVVKLGFTCQNIDDYLRAKRIAHDPKLLATMSGDEALETRFKQKWRHRLADGNEWFWPERDLFEWIVGEYDYLADGFRKHQEEAEELYAIWKRTFP